MLIDYYEALILPDSKLVGVAINYIQARHYITIDHYHTDIDGLIDGVEHEPTADTILQAGMYICIKSVKKSTLEIFCGDTGMP